MEKDEEIASEEQNKELMHLMKMIFFILDCSERRQ